MKATRYALLLLIGVGAALLFFLPRDTLALEGAPQAPLNAESAALAPPWDRLLQASSLVVRGRVVTTASAWDAAHTLIESRHVVVVHYGLAGDAPAQIEVQTTGGVLAEEGIGMLVTSLPTLTADEEVLLFLYATPQGYAIAGNDLGKFAVEGDRLRNRAILYNAPLVDAYQALAAIDAGVTIPEDWAAREALIQPEPVVGGLDFVYNNLKWFTNQVDYLVNVNSQSAGGENGSEQAFLEAIDAAGAAWNEVGEADFNLVYAGASESADIGLNSANEILFIDKGITDGNGAYMPLAVSRVYFFEADRRVIESDIWINDAYPWDVTGSPSGLEPDLQSVLIHEMGHWLVLGHDSDSRSIMFPTVTLGTLKRQLFDNDRRGISFIYPCPAGQQPCNPAATPTPTPTLTPTPTPTLTPTPSPTPTATPAPAHNTFVPNAGGLLTYTTSAGTHLSLTVPAQAFAVTTTLQIEHAAAARTAPGPDLREVDRFAITSTVTPGSSDPAPDALLFTVPFTLVMAYAEPAIDGLDEATLGFYTYDDTTEAWVAGGCGPPVRNATANRFESAICAPATYGLFATQLPSLYLPAVLRE